MSIQTKVVSVIVFFLTATAFAGPQAIERQTRSQFPSVNLDSGAAFEPAQEFVAGQIVSGMRAPGAPRVLYPASYNEAFVVELGKQRIALRAIGARFAQGAPSAGKLIYASPHD